MPIIRVHIVNILKYLNNQFGANSNPVLRWTSLGHLKHPKNNLLKKLQYTQILQHCSSYLDSICNRLVKRLFMLSTFFCRNYSNDLHGRFKENVGCVVRLPGDEIIPRWLCHLHGDVVHGPVHIVILQILPRWVKQSNLFFLLNFPFFFLSKLTLVLRYKDNL